MQTFSLPRQITRGAARRQGLSTADAAAAVGVSRATLYRRAAGADVLAIHADQIETYGGAEGVRDLGQLEAALFRP